MVLGGEGEVLTRLAGASFASPSVFSTSMSAAGAASFLSPHRPMMVAGWSSVCRRTKKEMRARVHVCVRACVQACARAPRLGEAKSHPIWMSMPYMACGHKMVGQGYDSKPRMKDGR